jgi:hypothetical protein
MLSSTCPAASEQPIFISLILMKVSISSYSYYSCREHKNSDNLSKEKVQLVLAFGAKGILSVENLCRKFRGQYPVANIVLCSTAGEIFEETVLDNSVSVTAIEFEKTRIEAVSVNIQEYPNSYDAGIALVKQLPVDDDLCYIMIIADGAMVNGSELVNGINAVIHHKVPVTGGLAGDGADFTSTLVGLNGEPVAGKIVAIGFYSRHLVVSHGSMGGWEMFGPERPISKSEANRLFEINGEPALDLYKKYLGPYAEELPGSALLFPLSVKLTPDSQAIVRTILSIDADSGSMLFAGNVPEGSQVRFMKANFDKLIDAAGSAATQTAGNIKDGSPKLALLISCVGRKIILGSRISEEVEAVCDTLGDDTLISGFYSYGEISPFTGNSRCELHNQTMTITTFNEK